MAIQEDHLRHRILQLNGLDPAPQPNHVAGVCHTVLGPSLSRLYGYKADLHQTGQHAFRRNESVAAAGPLMR